MTASSSERSRTHILFAHWGEEGIRGSERILLDLLARIDRDRFVPTLWCNAETMAMAARELDVPARVSRMPILLDWDGPKLDIGGYRALVREGENLIRESGARLVHANSGAPNQWMVPAARSARVPLVAHLHAVYGFRDRCTLLLHQVPLIVACSEAAARPFRSDGFPESRIRVIYNGIEPTRLNLGEARGLRRSLGVAEDAIFVVGVGAFVPLKGFDVVIRAFHLLHKRGVDAHLGIVGQGPERAHLEALAQQLGIRGRVHFLGAQSNVGAIFRDAADVIAIGSHVESFGLVAAEAGAVGRPVVATRVGGLVEVMEHGKTALLVPSGDFIAFADSLERLARDPLLRRELGAAARNHILTHFTAEQAALRFEQLYTELTARPAASFGWSALGFRVAPFVRLGLAVVARRLGARIADA